MKRLIPLLALATAGCVGPMSFAGMDADKIRELAKVKDATVTCVTGMNSVYGNLTIVTASIDKGITGGEVTVAEQCKVSIKSTTPWVPPAPILKQSDQSPPINLK